MLTQLGDWISQAIASMFVSVVKGYMQFILSAVQVAARPTWLAGEPWAQTALSTARAVAAGVMPVLVTWHSIRLYLLREGGEAADVRGFLQRTALAAAWAAGGPWVAGMVFQFGQYLSQSVADLGPQLQSLFAQYEEHWLASPALFGLGTLAGMLLTFVVFLVMFTLYLIQAGIRSFEFALLYILAPVLSLGLVGDPEATSWRAWLRELFVVASSHSVAVLLAYGGLHLALGRVEGYMTNVLYAIGALWLALRVPSWLRQFVYSSGIGGMAAGLGQSAATAVIHRVLMRLP